MSLLTTAQQASLMGVLETLAPFKSKPLTQARLHQMNHAANQELRRCENKLRDLGYLVESVEVSKLTCKVEHDGCGHVSIVPVLFQTQNEITAHVRKEP